MTPYEEGYAASMDGKSYRDNPYDVRVTEYVDWNLGFEDALASGDGEDEDD